MNVLLALLIICFASILSAGEFSPHEIQRELDKYLQAPQLPLNRLYPKKDNRGLAVFEINRDKNFVKAKIALRGEILPSFYSEPERNDNPRALIEDDPYTESIAAMEKEGLTKGEVKNKPWSDDYWPLYNGGPAARYNEENYPSSTDWKENFEYISQHPFFAIFEAAVPEAIDNLSPAEKYDLLIDKKSGTLTKALWSEGGHYYKAYGKVETWMGYCHGWAAASYMMKRPKHLVEVPAFDGKTKIRFYPDDIKSLQSLLWANSQPPTLYIGGRCNEKEPTVDEDGRPTNTSCRDNNPASWHLTVVNRVGLHKRSFVLDATYDYQVWNQPVVRYSYTYFNPQTMKAAPLDAAVLPVAQFSGDKFKKYRSRDTHSIVGVAMQITYGVERRPRHSPTDGPENDMTHTALYTYDLELDSRGNIVGGEWYNVPHPDFMWTPEKNAQALTKNDYYILGQPNWNGKSALPTNWRELAQDAAGRAQPLAKILFSLLELSNQSN